ncbi:MAG: carbamate kinase [Gemmatimonadota bacterium]
MTDAGIVVAIGGNALSPEGEEGTVAEQFRHVRESLGEVVQLAAEGWKIVIVHGNGPQVGNDLARQEIARSQIPPLPLGLLVAGTQGWIGYMIQQSLQNALADAGVERRVVTLVTQILVDQDDPALATPDKPIGRTMGEERAKALAADLGWHIAPVSGGWRRVVPSPRPLGTIEHRMIATLFAEGHLVVASGGGGVPVYRTAGDRIEGMDAVVDKDRAAAVLGLDIGADVLLILTDIDAVYTGYGTPRQERIARLDLHGAEALIASGELGAGSMAPKVEAAMRFVREGGDRAIITRLDLGGEGVAGEAGTEIVAG